MRGPNSQSIGQPRRGWHECEDQAYHATGEQDAGKEDDRQRHNRCPTRMRCRGRCCARRRIKINEPKYRHTNTDKISWPIGVR